MSRLVVLTSRPVGTPRAENWRIEPREIGEIPEGSVLVEVTDISMNPAMRNWLKEGRADSSVQIDAMMWAEAVGIVRESHDPSLLPGDAVFGMLGVQEQAVMRARHLTKLDPSHGPISLYLGLLGNQGLTAYLGLLEIAKVQAGETVVISAAAGAVGNVAVQIAKAQGCRVIGTTRSEEKARWLEDVLGADVGLVVSNEPGTEDTIAQQLAEACPEGINVFFDNTGGPILEAVLDTMATGARIVLCGGTSGYDQEQGPTGPRNYFQLVYREARMEGFLVMSYRDRFEQGREWIAEQIRSGRLVSYETVLGEGIESFPDAFTGLFDGHNTGKGLLRLADSADSLRSSTTSPKSAGASGPQGSESS